MSEISLGQFIKNVFDYSTGKMPAQQPGKVANEKFQRAQNEAMKMVQRNCPKYCQEYGKTAGYPEYTDDAETAYQYGTVVAYEAHV